MLVKIYRLVYFTAVFVGVLFAIYALCIVFTAEPSLIVVVGKALAYYGMAFIALSIPVLTGMVDIFGFWEDD